MIEIVQPDPGDEYRVIGSVWLSDDAPGQFYRLTRPFVVVVRGVGYECPADMLTDGASIPRLLWRAVGHPFQKPLIRGAVPHDAGYNGRLLLVETGKPVYLARLECDEMLRGVALAAGVGWPKSQTVYRGVRMGGVWSYHGGAPNA